MSVSALASRPPVQDFGHGQRRLARAQFIQHHLRQRRAAEADKVLVERHAQFLADSLEFRGAEIARARRDAHVHHALVRAKSEAESGIFIHHGANAPLDMDFGQAGGAQLQIRLAGVQHAGVLQAWERFGLEHRAQFIRGAGQHDEDFAGVLEINSRRGAKAVAQQVRAARAKALLAVVRAHLAAHARKPLLDGRFGGCVELQRQPEHLRHGLARVVVRSRPEAAGGDDDVRALPAIAKGGFDLAHLVAHDQIAAQRQTMASELATQIIEVRVDAQAKQQFVTQGQ